MEYAHILLDYSAGWHCIVLLQEMSQLQLWFSTQSYCKSKHVPNNCVVAERLLNFNRDIYFGSDFEFTGARKHEY